MTDSADGSGDAPSSDAGTDGTPGNPSGERDETTADEHGTGRGRPSDREAGADRPEGVVGWLGWFWRTDNGAVVYARDVATSVAAVLVVGLVLFAISGIWPPMVAVESGSMEPNMERGDLVFVVDNDRYVPDRAPTHTGESTGVVPASVAAETGHREFGEHGDVVVFTPNGDARRTPVIHRAMLWVEEGENWYDSADSGAVGGADDCEELRFCPAPHAGFITKGDNERTNSNYDQVTGLSAPVHPTWVVGTAELKVPYLGHVRLAFSQVSPAGPTPAAAATPLGTDAAMGTSGSETSTAGGTTGTSGPEAVPASGTRATGSSGVSAANATAATPQPVA